MQYTGNILLTYLFVSSGGATSTAFSKGGDADGTSLYEKQSHSFMRTHVCMDGMDGSTVVKVFHFGLVKTVQHCHHNTYCLCVTGFTILIS